ncbi:MAG: hypothetical protein K2Q26_09135 [Bdellovibrionales bacterium]|nr:hypothetical protein [Bdellovibrionales bacterium]
MKKTKFKKKATFPIGQPLAKKTATSLEQIEERLVKSILASTLALHILRSSRKPTFKLVNELLEMEFQVGQFVGRAMKMHSESLKSTNLKGALANALSFTPLNQSSSLLPSRSTISATKKRKRTFTKTNRKKSKKN